MYRGQPRFTRTDTRVPHTSLFRSDLHRVVDPRRTHVERAAKDEREAEHVVDLVGIIRPAGGDDHVGPHALGVGRADLGIGVRHHEHDRLGRSEEHTSELQSLMSSSYDVFSLKKKKKHKRHKFNKDKTQINLNRVKQNIANTLYNTTNKSPITQNNT